MDIASSDAFMFIKGILGEICILLLHHTVEMLVKRTKIAWLVALLSDKFN